jgi:hypothetical protein
VLTIPQWPARHKTLQGIAHRKATQGLEYDNVWQFRKRDSMQKASGSALIAAAAVLAMASMTAGAEGLDAGQATSAEADAQPSNL